MAKKKEEQYSFKENPMQFLVQAKSITIPEGTPVIEYDNIINFMLDANDSSVLYQYGEFVYAFTSQGMFNIIICIDNFEDKYKEYVKAGAKKK